MIYVHGKGLYRYCIILSYQGKVDQWREAMTSKQGAVSLTSKIGKQSNWSTTFGDRINAQSGIRTFRSARARSSPESKVGMFS